jgi:alpha,alpha-trehalase
MDLLRRAVPTLDKEYQFWMTNRSVLLRDSRGTFHILNNYNVTNFRPRPESYWNDLQTANAVPEEERPALWGNIATGAETG